MTLPELCAWLAKSWPGLTIAGEWAHELRCGDVVVAQIRWTEAWKLAGILPYLGRPNNWHKGKRAMRRAINGALDALAAHHEATVARLRAVRGGQNG